ncbi:hypothetical protein [Segniliparus rugosus]|uniref:Uncharacterized protein n=1 Tax=Segniliparus rugosus (strain ATCC BAA-974 / DSM 45345 / CCUG 50838 / CIP 108380 / JCM 13579 / CDC 945) TaxID=679197 RepID=E5XSC7_SEGRC|nr:hypothetical protein [Segniliparus rugosus]EFV12747.1 hypothetical protein HMPREF9336_02399 [Segniliparus rugosus ATCC BAA-974]
MAKGLVPPHDRGEPSACRLAVELPQFWIPSLWAAAPVAAEVLATRATWAGYNAVMAE